VIALLNIFSFSADKDLLLQMGMAYFLTPVTALAALILAV
jgi:hypothetical protein